MVATVTRRAVLAALAALAGSCFVGPAQAKPRLLAGLYGDVYATLY